ncbi:hypothetical protein K474DRAFT_1711186 [Panus rudis PR-1116 ss-1]|nr:hypothetical protein K474DRAFT_1711186 [Panus rudis PR-1116 ss-1]
MLDVEVLSLALTGLCPVCDICGVVCCYNKAIYLIILTFFTCFTPTSSRATFASVVFGSRLALRDGSADPESASFLELVEPELGKVRPLSRVSQFRGGHFRALSNPCSIYHHFHVFVHLLNEVNLTAEVAVPQQALVALPLPESHMDHGYSFSTPPSFPASPLSRKRARFEREQSVQPLDCNLIPRPLEQLNRCLSTPAHLEFFTDGVDSSPAPAAPLSLLPSALPSSSGPLMPAHFEFFTDGVDPSPSAPGGCLSLLPSALLPSSGPLTAALPDSSLSDKGTSKSYAQHVRNYMTWWSLYQQEENEKNPARILIPTEPITSAKVAMFLQHEISHPKCKRGSDESLEGTTVGKSAIVQAISALESHRVENAHLYKADRDAQVPLRTDNCVRAFKNAAKHNEPKRIEQAQVLKAAGTTADTYNNTQL